MFNTPNLKCQFEMHAAQEEQTQKDAKKTKTAKCSQQIRAVSPTSRLSRSLNQIVDPG